LLKVISIALSVLIASIFSVLCFFFAAKTLPWESLTTNWEELAIALLLILLGLFWLWDPIRAVFKTGIPLLLDVLGGRVKMEQGAVGKNYDDTVYRSLWHRILDWVFSFFSDGFDKYLEPFCGAHYYLLGEQKFMVSQKGYNALNEGSIYRLYYLTGSRQLINIEPLSNQPNS